jgi:predicted secreted protein
MPRYTVTHAKAGVNTANTIMWQLRAATNERVELLELALTVKVAPTTGPSWRLNRATAIGTSTATVTPPHEDDGISNIAAGARLDTTWSANPTLGGTDLREYATPNSIGSGIVWTWYGRPIRISSASGLCLVNGNATGATLGTLVIYAVIDL